GSTEEKCSFSATSAASVPAELSVNTWGYALPGVTGFSEANAYITTGGKKSQGIEGIGDAESGTEVDPSNKFMAVPAVADSEPIVTGNQRQVDGKDYYIYYGILADTSKVSGTYQATVVYTALAEANDTAGGKITSVAPDNCKTLDCSYHDPEDVTKDDSSTVMFTTSLYGSVAMIDKVQRDMENTVSVKIGGWDCTNPSLSIPDESAGTGPIQVQCTVPTAAKWGSYDVAISLGDYGTYNKRAGFSYYVPWDVMVDHPGEYTMQQFSTKACSEAPTPEATKNGHIVGSYVSNRTTNSWYGLDGEPTNVFPLPQVTLMDSRDGRVYLVRKYADGNCWMAQNLELTFADQNNALSPNISTMAKKIQKADGTVGATTLTANDTDLHSVSSIDISQESNKVFATQYVAGGTSGTHSDYAWNDAGTDGMRSFSLAAYNSGNELYGIETGAVNSYGQKEFTTSSDGKPQERGGNLYNWTAATLKSGLNITGVDVEDSICPANWQLPTNEESLTNGSGRNYSIVGLLKAYYGSAASGNPRTGSTAAKPSELTQMQNLLRSEPISMVVSGLYYRSNGTLVGRTVDGGYVWSSTASTAINARYLGTNPADFSPQASAVRGYGFTVRCVSR
ncbi:MAG: FISUMP domain-containing protein, partial [Candidatus Saccharibacteria bacterium]|nr:FISUMP domain-containing protein [Candidatus Saccharibacteria bacterium]